jgi:hypothetical protein
LFSKIDLSLINALLVQLFPINTHKIKFYPKKTKIIRDEKDTL